MGKKFIDVFFRKSFKKESINSFASLNSKRLLHNSSKKKNMKNSHHDMSPKDRIKELKKSQKNSGYTSPFKFKSRQKISRLIKTNKPPIESDSGKIKKIIFVRKNYKIQKMEPDEENRSEIRT